MPEPDLILFDGTCNLCSGVVQRLIALDDAGRFQFAALQSGRGLASLAAHGVRPPEAGGPDSVVLLPAEGGILLHSAAALGIMRRLGGGWRILAGLGRVVPPGLRDAAYRWVARNRYRWFGQKNECWLPTPALRARFVE